MRAVRQHEDNDGYKNHQSADTARNHAQQPGALLWESPSGEAGTNEQSDENRRGRNKNSDHGRAKHDNKRDDQPNQHGWQDRFPMARACFGHALKSYDQ